MHTVDMGKHYCIQEKVEVNKQLWSDSSVQPTQRRVSQSWGILPQLKEQSNIKNYTRGKLFCTGCNLVFSYASEEKVCNSRGRGFEKTNDCNNIPREAYRCCWRTWIGMLLLGLIHDLIHNSQLSPCHVFYCIGKGYTKCIPGTLRVPLGVLNGRLQV